MEGSQKSLKATSKCCSHLNALGVVNKSVRSVLLSHPFSTANWGSGGAVPTDIKGRAGI